MRANDLLLDAAERVHELIPVVLEGLTVDDVLWRPDPGANSIGWLIWHLTRIEDDHLAGVAESEQVWHTGRFVERFHLPYPPDEHGFSMSAQDVGRFRVDSPALLSAYAAAVAESARAIIARLTDADFDRIVDTSYQPPVTAGVRLVSVVDDMAQHIGQAGYVRGLRERALGRSSAWAGIA